MKQVISLLLLCLLVLLPGTLLASLPRDGPAATIAQEPEIPRVKSSPAHQPEEPADSPIDSIEEALGTLGILAAFMLVLAVGTESVIDGVKVALGFKRKPTALEAVNKLREWLPGQLQEMGADVAAVRQLNNTLDAMSTHMADVDKTATMLAAVDEWLPDALKNLAVHNVESLLDLNLPALTSKLQAAGISDSDINTLETWLRGALSTLEATTAQELLTQAEGFLKRLGQPEQIEKAIRGNLEAWLPNQLRTLTTQGAQKLLETQLPQLEARLGKAGVPPEATQHLKTWLSAAITYLDTAGDDIYAAALTNILQGVEDRRETIHSPLRKIVRWIKRKLGQAEIPLAADRIILPLNPTNMARTLLQRDDFHRDEEISRLRWLRVISVVVGIALATMLQIDVGDLLKPIITAGQFDLLTREFPTAMTAAAAYQMWGVFWWIPWGVGNLLSSMSIGILLSGLAASAGSTFWHDLLDRLQTSKKAATEVRDLVAQLRQLEAQGE